MRFFIPKNFEIIIKGEVVFDYYMLNKIYNNNEYYLESKIKKDIFYVENDKISQLHCLKYRIAGLFFYLEYDGEFVDILLFYKGVVINV